MVTVFSEVKMLEVTDKNIRFSDSVQILFADAIYINIIILCPQYKRDYVFEHAIFRKYVCLESNGDRKKYTKTETAVLVFWSEKQLLLLKNKTQGPERLYYR